MHEILFLIRVFDRIWREVKSGRGSLDLDRSRFRRDLCFCETFSSSFFFLFICSKVSVSNRLSVKFNNLRKGREDGRGR